VKNIHGSIGAERGILANSVPHDVVARSQRQRILEAIAECCAEKTYAGTTIADIVSKAGVSRRTFYKLFANKRDCFEAAINSFAEEVSTIVAEARASGDPWPEMVREAIAAILDLLASKPAFANMALVEAIGVDPRLINRYWDPLIDALKDSVEGEAVSAGAARAAVGTAQVLIAQYVSSGRGEELRELEADLVYISLAPFVGQEEALAQARLVR
jgi:AcrR family transcriptional regulator